jgi:hypothetical protein
MKTNSVYVDTVSQATAAMHRAGNGWFGGDLQLWRIIAIVVLVAIGISFIATVLKLLLDHRLKSKLLERELPEEQVRLILASSQNPLKESALKWLLTATGVTAGLLIAGLAETGPVLSMAIVSAGIAASFGLYYLMIRK